MRTLLTVRHSPCLLVGKEATSISCPEYLQITINSWLRAEALKQRDLALPLTGNLMLGNLLTFFENVLSHVENEDT